MIGATNSAGRTGDPGDFRHPEEIPRLRKLKVAVGVSPRPLLRVIEHLLCSERSLEIVSRCSSRNHLLSHSCRLSPELIVVNTRLLGRRVSETLAEMRRISPGSRLILIDPFKGFTAQTRACGADGHLYEEVLVKTLPKVVRRLRRDIKMSV
jgi:two-component SAPR family response regulator